MPSWMQQIWDNSGSGVTKWSRNSDDVITKVTSSKTTGRTTQRDVSMVITLSILANKNDDLSKTIFNKSNGSVRLSNFEGNAQSYFSGPDIMTNDNVSNVTINYKVVYSIDDIGDNDNVMMLVNSIPKKFGDKSDPVGLADIGGRISVVERGTLLNGRFNEVAQHEIGHNLGMTHSFDGNGLMGATVNGQTFFNKVKRAEMLSQQIDSQQGVGIYKNSTYSNFYKTSTRTALNIFLTANKIN